MSTRTSGASVLRDNSRLVLGGGASTLEMNVSRKPPCIKTSNSPSLLFIATSKPIRLLVSVCVK